MMSIYLIIIYCIVIIYMVFVSVKSFYFTKEEINKLNKKEDEY